MMSETKYLRRLLDEPHRAFEVVDVLDVGEVDRERVHERACVELERRIGDLELMLRAALRSKCRLHRAYPIGHHLAKFGRIDTDSKGLPVLCERSRAVLKRHESLALSRIEKDSRR